MRKDVRTAAVISFMNNPAEKWLKSTKSIVKADFNCKKNYLTKIDAGAKSQIESECRIIL